MVANCDRFIVDRNVYHCLWDHMGLLVLRRGRSPRLPWLSTHHINFLVCDWQGINKQLLNGVAWRRLAIIAKRRPIDHNQSASVEAVPPLAGFSSSVYDCPSGVSNCFCTRSFLLYHSLTNVAIVLAFDFGESIGSVRTTTVRGNAVSGIQLIYSQDGKLYCSTFRLDFLFLATRGRGV